MLSFLFVEEGELFLKKSSFEEFNLVFFTAEHMVCFEMQPRAAKFLLNFQVLFALYGQEITFLKGNLCIFQCFIDVLYFFLFGAKEKLQNVPRF